MKQIVYCMLSVMLIASILFSTQTVFAQTASLRGQPRSTIANHHVMTQEKPSKKATLDKAQATGGGRHGHVLDLSSVVPDPAFGTNGSVRTFISGGNRTRDQAHSVAMQSDGKIVVAGYSRDAQDHDYFALARYGADGSRDQPAFGDGTLRSFINGGNATDDRANSVAIQSDGKIVVAGYSKDASGHGAFALARFNTNGFSDITFGTGGSTRNYIYGGDSTYDGALSVAIQSDGKIIVAGQSDSSGNGAFALARYDTNGSLDGTFGTGGTVRNYIYGGNSTGDIAYAVAIEPDGKIVATGASLDASLHYAFALARYNTDGSLDSSFGTNGTTRDNIGGGDGTGDEAFSVVIQPDGKMVAAGMSDGGGGFAFALARYKTDGNLDSTFGTNGMVRNYISGGSSSDNASSVALQADGKIVAAGQSNFEFALARYTIDGSLDSAFGINGTTRNAISGGSGADDQAQSVAIQSDGKIVAAGFSLDASLNYAFAVARYVVHPVDISVSGATSITTTGATLNGTVNGFNVSTTARFLYGTSSGVYSDSVDATPGTVSADADVPVSAAVTGLSPGQTYYYTISTTSSEGYYVGLEMSCTTSYATAGKALKFNGSDTYVSIPWSASFDISNSFAIEFWVDIQDTTQTDKYLIARNGISAGDQFGVIYGYVQNTVEFYAAGYGGDNPRTGSQIRIPSPGWHHVAYSYDGTNFNGFLDGRLIFSSATIFSLSTVPNDLQIGGVLDPGPPSNILQVFSGVMDEVRIWNVGIDSNKIRLDVHRTLGGTETGLAGYWKFDEGTGTATSDQASGGYGTLENFTFDGTTNGWITSTIPVGLGTSDSTTNFTTGTAALGTVSLTTTDNFDNPVGLFSTQITASPDSLPYGSITVLNDRYWVIHAYGMPGTFSTNLTFTVPSSFTNNGAASPSLYTLYTRSSTSESSWNTAVSGASAITPTTVTFNGITSFSQFTIGTDAALPIQLASLTAATVTTGVRIEWTTVSETNNYGFYVERKSRTGGAFTTVSNLIPGARTSLQAHHYFWLDSTVTTGSYVYRLRQVDLNGAASYSQQIAVSVVLAVGDDPAPRKFQLLQSYPNPFNPSATIKFSVEQSEHARLIVYDMLGQEVAKLFDGMAEPGNYYRLTFDGSRVGSGLYIYRIVTESHTDVKKMLLLK